MYGILMVAWVQHLIVILILTELTKLQTVSAFIMMDMKELILLCTMSQFLLQQVAL